MAPVAAVLSALIGVGASLCMLVLLMAGGANAKPATITQIKWLMAAVALVGVGALAACVWAFVKQRYWLAASAGGAPLVFVIGLGIVLVLLEW